MAVTLADVDRWDAGAVRDVSTALGKRGASADEVKQGLSKLPMIATWQGTGGDAARAALDKLSRNLAAHVEEMASVGSAITKSADEIHAVKDALKAIDRDANYEGFSVDRTTGAVTPRYPDNTDPLYLLGKMDLEARVAKVLAEANTADADLARAITMAGHDATGPAESRPDIRAALEKPLPEDSKQFTDLWNQLTPQEKDWLYAKDHFIGNHPGMPFDPNDHLGRDHYNRRHLTEMLPEQQAKVDAMQRQFDDLARRAYMGERGGGPSPEALGQQLIAERQKLDGYRAVDSTLNKSSSDGAPRYLGLLDDKGHAAVSVENPDTAKKVATFVPGTGQDMAAFEGSDLKSVRMQGAAVAADPSLTAHDVSVTTWMGYDRPMDVPHAGSTLPATSGAGNLDAFQNGLRASHVGDPSLNTVIGHSYGSTIVGAAGSGGHHLDANNVIAVGSPGMLVSSAAELSLDPGAQVFATRASNDIIGAVTGTKLGPDPVAQSFGSIGLMAAAGPSSDPLGISPSIAAHSSYWNPGNVALDNMGAVIAGVPPPSIGYPSG